MKTTWMKTTWILLAMALIVAPAQAAEPAPMPAVIDVESAPVAVAAELPSTTPEATWPPTFAVEAYGESTGTAAAARSQRMAPMCPPDTQCSTLGGPACSPINCRAVPIPPCSGPGVKNCSVTGNFFRTVCDCTCGAGACTAVCNQQEESTVTCT